MLRTRTWLRAIVFGAIWVTFGLSAAAEERVAVTIREVFERSHRIEVRARTEVSLVKAKGVRAAVTSSGYQEPMVLVKGGYTSDVIVVEAGQPVRLTFVRQESASCSEMVHG